MVNGDARTSRHAASVVPEPASRYARPAIAVVLLLAVIAGVGAARPPLANGPLHRHGTVVGLVLELVLGASLCALWLVGRRPLAAAGPAAWARIRVGWAICLVMIGVAMALFANLLLHRGASRLLWKVYHTGKPLHEPKVSASKSGAFAPDPTYLLYGVIALLLLAVFVGALILLSRRRPSGRPGRLAEAADPTADLQRAVESGRAALRTTDDARAAIIACYLAMESSLADAGTERAAAETPYELLHKAAVAGLIHGPAATRLTELFYLARFSTRPLPAIAITEAADALQVISASLGQPAAAGGLR